MKSFLFTAAAIAAAAASAIPILRANADDAADPIAASLAQCAEPKAENGQYTSHDGGASAVAIVQQCGDEFSAWLQDCEGQGRTEKDCTLAAVGGVQMTLIRFGK